VLYKFLTRAGDSPGARSGKLAVAVGQRASIKGETRGRGAWSTGLVGIYHDLRWPGTACIWAGKSSGPTRLPEFFLLLARVPKVPSQPLKSAGGSPSSSISDRVHPESPPLPLPCSP